MGKICNHYIKKERLYYARANEINFSNDSDDQGLTFFDCSLVDDGKCFKLAPMSFPESNSSDCLPLPGMKSLFHAKKPLRIAKSPALVCRSSKRCPTLEALVCFYCVRIFLKPEHLHIHESSFCNGSTLKVDVTFYALSEGTKIIQDGLKFIFLKIGKQWKGFVGNEVVTP